MSEIKTFTAKAVTGKKGTWTIELNDETMRLTPPQGGDVIEVNKSDRKSVCDFLSPPFGDRQLVIKQEKKQPLAIKKEDVPIIEEWFGPLTRADLAESLKQYFKWMLPVAIIFLVGSLPISGDPASGTSALPLDVTGIALGASLLVLWFLSRKWIHRTIFLLDCIWFTVLGADLTYDVYKGDSIYFLFILPFILFTIVMVWGEYKRFATVVDDEGTVSGS